MHQLDLAIRTLYTEFQEAALKRADLERTTRAQEMLVRKRVKGKVYWYRQQSIAGKTVQHYVGPSSLERDRTIEAQRDDRRETVSLIRKLIVDERRKAAMLKRGGLPSLDAATADVLDELSRSRLIDGGGMLIGSYAFSVFAGMLGCLFEKDSLKTVDIDIAQDRSLAVALKAPVEMLMLLRETGRPWRAVPGLSPKTLPVSFIGPGGLRIDLVTPLRGKERGPSRACGIADAGAQPLRFLDYLMEETLRSVLIGPRGGIPVTIPTPERFALHKLIIASRRPATESAKRMKDIAQATQLIMACAKERPTELAQALSEARKRGPAWRKTIDQGMRFLPLEAAQKL